MESLNCIGCGKHLRDELKMCEEEKEERLKIFSSPVFDSFQCNQCCRQEDFWGWLWSIIYDWYELKVLELMWWRYR